MTAPFNVGLDMEFPFFGGSVSSGFEAGTTYPVTLGGMAFGLDLRDKWPFQHSSVPNLRPAQDDKENAGRQTLNPEAFWRRTFESWHYGAGQTHFDRVGTIDESNPFRFRRSKNIHVWDRYQFSLLPATDQKVSGLGTNVFLAVAGDYLYFTDGTLLKRTQDITVDTPTITTITGTPAVNASSIASDGFNVLTAHGASGIYKTTRGAATTASNITGTVAHVFYGKGRWIAAQDNNLYDVTTLVAGGGALPAALFSQANTDFDWNSFAEGPTALYAAGVSGDKSLIYRLTMKEDGTGLNQPVVAGFLPDGELLYSMQGYLGFVLLGTSKGVRVGVPGGNGDLTIGAFIPTDAPVRCFEGQGTFVWFGWSDYESNDSGLGRLNMETFTDPDALAPAYASDLMVGATGTIHSIATFQNLRVFTRESASAGSIYAEQQSVLAATGELDTGLFDYGLTDEKIGLFIDTSHPETHEGAHSVSLSVDGATFGSLGVFDHAQPIPTGEARGSTFELRFTLTRDPIDTTAGPALSSLAMRAQPTVPMTEEIVAPLLIGPVGDRMDGFAEHVDPIEQRNHIKDLRRTQAIAHYTEGSEQWSVIVVDYEFHLRNVYTAHDQALGVQGTCLVRMKTVN